MFHTSYPLRLRLTLLSGTRVRLLLAGLDMAQQHRWIPPGVQIMQIFRECVFRGMAGNQRRRLCVLRITADASVRESAFRIIKAWASTYWSSGVSYTVTILHVGSTNGRRLIFRTSSAGATGRECCSMMHSSPTMSALFPQNCMEFPTSNSTVKEQHSTLWSCLMDVTMNTGTSATRLSPFQRVGTDTS
jgi:hypothetical protein